MNQVGYDLVVPGNHEFDFGMEQHFNLTEMLNSEVICANFTNLQSNLPVYKPYAILKYGKVEIAFIGIGNPGTATSVSPKTFWDENGNTKYSFLPDDLFPTIQQHVNEVRRNGADYVVILSHLGVDKEEDYPSSPEFIANTYGIDVVLDGHSHVTIQDSILLDSKGKEVLLSSSGSYFQNIGILTLSTDGKFTAELVEASSVQKDSSVLEVVSKVKESAMEAGRKVIGLSGITMNALDANGEWLVREREMPIGNFCADAFRTVLDTDIAMINGGGIRADLPAGEVSYNTLISVFPFKNTACKAAITGQQLLDALEVSVMELPERSGSFMQVSGLKFKVNQAVATPVVLDGKDLFSHIGDGKRRVSDVQVLDKASGKYMPVDPERTYTLGGINYTITRMGCDGIFRYAQLLQDNIAQDVEVLATYLQMQGGKIGREYSETQGRIFINN
jgi:2',3'-cyclic-nucleotide 2'-phosphodiesterase (5'-nucleotidase family)